LAVADILANPGARIRYVYFPLDSFISLIAPLDRRVQLEVGLVGNEGMLGASLALGQNTEPLRAIVHGAGLAWRVNAATFVRELERNALLSSAVNRYLYVLMCQLAQTSVCTRFHFVDARLARWLLMARDRSHSSKLQVTQELLARVLGVRRVGVTRAATKMRRGTLVLYSRGSLEILDAQRLEAVACECYANAKAIYASMLGAADVSAGGRR
jgi:CRP-like cAMP-binding protein